MNDVRSFSLAQISNYRIGGLADHFLEVTTRRELRAALAAVRDKKFFVVGGGTNLLISDAGFAGTVIKPSLRRLTRRGNIVCAEAGVLMSELLAFCTTHSLSGLEWAGGLPGTVGGAVRGNAGCFGGETKDVIVRVASVDTKTLAIKLRSAAQCDFRYRSSIFKKSGTREVITAAWFQLRPGKKSLITRAIREKIELRQERHPLEYPNIGSIFKNIPLKRFLKESGIPKAQIVKTLPVKTDPFPVIPAVVLIAQVGLQGTRIGGAMISRKHANFIVNVSHATAHDVEQLISLMKLRVKKKFHVMLEEEIQRLS